MTTERSLNRWDRAKLALFALRHLAGVAFLVWLTLLARRTGPNSPWLVLAGLTLAFAAFAGVTWFRLLGIYRGRGGTRHRTRSG